MFRWSITSQLALAGDVPGADIRKDTVRLMESTTSESPPGLSIRLPRFLREMFDAEFISDNRLETDEFFSRMIRIGDIPLELLEPRSDDGRIERFLNQRGEGMHH